MNFLIVLTKIEFTHTVENFSITEKPNTKIIKYRYYNITLAYINVHTPFLMLRVRGKQLKTHVYNIL